MKLQTKTIKWKSKIYCKIKIRNLMDFKYWIVQMKLTSQSWFKIQIWMKMEY